MEEAWEELQNPVSATVKFHVTVKRFSVNLATIFEKHFRKWFVMKFYGNMLIK